MADDEGVNIREHASDFIKFLETSNKSKVKHLNDLEKEYKLYVQLSEESVDFHYELVQELLDCKFLNVKDDGTIIFISEKKAENQKKGPNSRKPQSQSCQSVKDETENVVNRNISFCPLCRRQFDTPRGLETHKSSKMHELNKLRRWFRDNKAELLSSKNDIEIFCKKEPQDEKKIKSELVVTPNTQGEVYFDIHNCGHQSVFLRDCFLFHNPGFITLEEFDEKKEVKSGLNVPIAMYLFPTEVMVEVATVFFKLEIQNSIFFMAHELKINVATEKLLSHIGDATVPEAGKRPLRFQKNEKRVLLPTALTSIPAPPRPKKPHYSLLETSLDLDEYLVPDQIEGIVKHMLEEWPGMSVHQCNILDSMKLLFYDGMTRENYYEMMKTLLFLEECQLQIDIRAYDMGNIDMFTSEVAKKKLVMVNVPGLSEGRPSVLVGDLVKMRVMLDEFTADSIEYDGVVSRVKENTIYVSANVKFLKLVETAKDEEERKFAIQFLLNRKNFRLMHRALSMVEDNEQYFHLIYPSINSAAKLPPVWNVEDNLTFFNPHIYGNEQQQTAILHILAGTSRPAPYLLFGPPGTGKTMTIVEAIKQIWKNIEEAHILICTPSNSSADVIAERLLNTSRDDCPPEECLSEDDVFRMYGLSFPTERIPSEIINSSNYTEKYNSYYFPCRIDLMNYRIVITTIMTSSRLVGAQFPENHFTHVFIDECGQSMEPESLIPAVGLLQSIEDDEGKFPGVGGHLILSGDPKQLGPVIRSNVITKNGYDTSLLERLMDNCEVYQRRENGQYDSNVMTKLIQNYRSHPAILKLPNQMFYDGELQACANKRERNHYLGWEKLPNPKFPVLFHGVLGQDMKEPQSPSFFNPQEMVVVIEYAKALMTCSDSRYRTKPEDIGIISPYRRQVQKLQQAVKEIEVPDIENLVVDSVEKFQGQERKVIIASTVRSTPNTVAMDFHHKIGFLKNPKRYNVTITRAKSLLIVIGNPYILQCDKNWNGLIQHCIQNNSYVGAEFKTNTDMMEEINRTYEQLKLIEAGQLDDRVIFEGYSQISHRTLQEEPAWSVVE